MPPQFSDLELQVLAEMGVRPDDPAAEVMLNRIAEVKDLETVGDPAFQSGSQYFGSRHGAGVESALGLFGPVGGDEEDLLQMLTRLWEQQQAGDSYGRVPVAQQLAAEKAAATAAYQRALQMTGLEQKFERGQLEEGLGRKSTQSRLGRELESMLAGMTQTREKEQRESEMRHSGQASMIDIFGRDPAQSVLFELGATGGGYGEMPPL